MQISQTEKSFQGKIGKGDIGNKYLKQAVLLLYSYFLEF